MSWTRFFDRPEWKEHCEKWSGFRDSPLVGTLLAEIDSRNVSDLVERYQSPQLPHEADACEGLFYLFLKNRDRRFGKDDQEALANVLYQRIIDDEFHRRKDHERWPLSELWAMAAAASAVDTFVETAAETGTYNVARDRALKARRILKDAPQDAIEALSQKWRASHDTESLNALYHGYLDALPVGTSMEPWLRRLGEPSTRADRFATYATVDGRYALYIEMDSEGGLCGISLKDY